MLTQERSVSDVLHDIVGKIQDIVRGEVRLAKTEAREEIVRARSAAAIVAVGTLSGIFGTLFVLLVCACGLALVMPAWAAAATVAAVLLVCCVIVLNTGIKQLGRVVALSRTTHGIKETLQ